ncbi:glycosyltransferase [Hydrogenophaga flava]|uniref:glycosyltransferase n=1 Tax=Hydrogenophaga flava TaxID=65657 RepID=UPI0008244B03|nr:glycosyltransferase [Hydrogenophaga flava]
MTERTQFVSYWETVPGHTMPPYVAMALGWTRHVLGDAFRLLTPINLAEAINTAHLNKDWRFHALEFDASAAAISVVAKSDYIRLAYVLEHGGVWLDADTVLFGHLSPSVFPLALDERLHWYSEALFGARSGNDLLRQATRNCLDRGYQDWGDPGAIRATIARNERAVLHIPQDHFDPGFRPMYNFKTCDIMFDRTLPADRFLSNAGLKVLKLYNTYFSRSPMGNMGLEEFLSSDFLLARIFLRLMPDRTFWRACGNEMLELARQQRPTHVRCPALDIGGTIGLGS